MAAQFHENYMIVIFKRHNMVRSITEIKTTTFKSVHSAEFKLNRNWFLRLPYFFCDPSTFHQKQQFIFMMILHQQYSRTNTMHFNTKKISFYCSFFYVFSTVQFFFLSSFLFWVFFFFSLIFFSFFSFFSVCSLI